MAKASKNRKAAYYCEHCNAFYSITDYTSGYAYYVTGYIEDSYYEDADREAVWWCRNGCFHHDEGGDPDEYDEDTYICGVCGAVYTEMESARECCL